MALIKPLVGTLSWTASDSADVVGYRVYHGLEGFVLDEAQATADGLFLDVGNVTAMAIADMGLPAFDGGALDFYVAAIDDAGNVSDPDQKVTVPFDNVPPNPPSNSQFVAS